MPALPPKSRVRSPPGARLIFQEPIHPEIAVHQRRIESLGWCRQDVGTCVDGRSDHGSGESRARGSRAAKSIRKSKSRQGGVELTGSQAPSNERSDKSVDRGAQGVGVCSRAWGEDCAVTGFDRSSVGVACSLPDKMPVFPPSCLEARQWIQGL